ncbi:MAG: ANTAR domain-containing response regulator [Eubacteriales bacterium]|jgi:AmiR/NasT family two-component response regulator
MESVLLVSGSAKGAEALEALLSNGSFDPIIQARSGGEARRIMARQTFSLIVINTPLTDEFGHDLGSFAAQSTTAGVLLLVKADLAQDIGARVEPDGAFVIAKPFPKQLALQSIRLALASHHRMAGLERENLRLQDKIEEIRLVDRAKCALIQYCKFDEAQAHRYIEKHAMDLRQTRRQVAESILKLYEE